MKKEIIVNMIDSEGATPIARLVQVANSFESSAYIVNDGVKVNAKSIMGMMNVVISNGSSVVLEVTGIDEADAMEAIEKFLKKSS